MNVKEESEKVGLKFSLWKMKIMASGPIFVAAQLEDLGDRRRGLLSCFLSSREVAAAAAAEVEGMGLG